MPKARPPRPNRGPIPYTNTVSAETFDPPIEWIYVAAIGSGGLVVKDENGATRTYTSTHLATGSVLFGPFSEIVSTTCAALLAGDGEAPRSLPLAHAAPAMQAVNATLVSGTATINTAIAVAADSEVIAYPKGAITGSSNFGCVRELAASRVVGAAGVGTVVIEAVGADGAKDADAAGAVRVVILTPQ